MTEFLFDEFVIDAARHELRRGVEVLDLEPKSFRVLLLLAENRDRVVSKEELFEKVWAGTSVTDNALTRVIAQLRKALGDDAKQARYIETVPTVGYRFIARLEPGPAAPPREPESPPRRINWWVPVGAIGAVVLAYFMPFFRQWSAHGLPSLKHTQFTSAAGLEMHPSFSPDGGSVVYASDQTGHFQIYVRQLGAGGREIALTNDESENLQPAWSPDGTYVAYYRLLDNGIFLTPALGGQPRKLTEFGSQPVWTPDGKAIVFRSEGLVSLAAPDIPPNSYSTIWSVPATGGKPVPLTKPNEPEGRHSEPAISPDGRYVAFVSYGGVGKSALWELDLQTGITERLQDGSPYAYSPVYARDGKSIYAIGALDGDVSAILRFDLDLRKRTPAGPPQVLGRFEIGILRDLTVAPNNHRLAYTISGMASNLWSVTDGQMRAHTNETSYRITQPAFSREGERLAYLVRRKGILGDVWVADTSGANATQITRHPNTDYAPSWPPDGGSVVFSAVREGKKNLWRFSFSDGAERPFAEMPAWASSGKISPDGREVVFHKEGPVREIWKMEVRTGKLVQLTEDSRAAGYPVWSPDGKRISFELFESDSTHLAVIGSEGGPIRQLTNRPGHAWSYSWSPDGKEIAIAARWENAWNLYAADAERGSVRNLTGNRLLRVFFRYPAWSPKGKPVIFEHNETRGDVFLAELPSP
jgi:Tol biopolymer transport system component/DNA-binding winged helix-turn-helix (wHTH) protein